MSFFKKLFGMSERIKEEPPKDFQEIKVKQLKEYLGKYYGKNIKNKKISKECKIIQEIETITFL